MGSRSQSPSSMLYFGHRAGRSSPTGCAHASRPRGRAGAVGRYRVLVRGPARRPSGLMPRTPAASRSPPQASAQPTSRGERRLLPPALGWWAAASAPRTSAMPGCAESPRPDAGAAIPCSPSSRGCSASSEARCGAGLACCAGVACDALTEGALPRSPGSGLGAGRAIGFVLDTECGEGCRARAGSGCGARSGRNDASGRSRFGRGTSSRSRFGRGTSGRSRFGRGTARGTGAGAGAATGCAGRGAGAGALAGGLGLGAPTGGGRKLSGS
jgi:hypothetical protein